MFECCRDDIAADARAAFPNATCGAIFGNVGAETYCRIDDVLDNSRIGFRVVRSVLERLEKSRGPLRGLIHSHPWVGEGDVDPLLFTPSAAEMRAQVEAAVPFAIIVCGGSRTPETFWFGDQCPVQPYLGRPFQHGIFDCYSLVRDWYRQERNAVLPEFPRDWNWWRDGLDMYQLGFEQAGFRRIQPKEFTAGDSVLIRMRSKVPNHAAVIIGDGLMILHHPASLKPYDPSRRSATHPLHRWIPYVTHWVRYYGD